MTQLSNDDLKALIELASLATPGPWEADVEELQVVAADQTLAAQCYISVDGEDNVKFIAASRNALPALIAECKRLREECERLKDWKSEWIEGEPDKIYRDSWFIAKLKDGTRAVIKSLPWDYAHQYKTADETYYTKDWVLAWMPLPDCEFITPKEERDSLRAEIKRRQELVWEAVGKCNHFCILQGNSAIFCPSHSGLARQALAEIKEQT
jgi:hypothetical protein